MNENTFNRVVIADPNYGKCVRPVSMSKQRAVVYNTNNQLVHKPATTVYTTQVVSPQKQVMVSPLIINSQPTNIITTTETSPHLSKASALKRKRVVL